MKNSFKGYALVFLSLALAFTPMAIQLGNPGTSLFWTLAIFSPLAIGCGVAGARFLGRDFADGVGDSIKDGFNKAWDRYVESGKFSQDMDAAFQSTCASLAEEAEAAGNRNLATGYRVFGGIPPKSENLGTVVFGRDGDILVVVDAGHDEPNVRANAIACFPHLTGESGVFTLQDDLLSFHYKWQDGVCTAQLIYQPRQHQLV